MDDIANLIATIESLTVENKALKIENKKLEAENTTLRHSLSTFIKKPKRVLQISRKNMKILKEKRQLQFTDSLTQVSNRGRFDKDIISFIQESLIPYLETAKSLLKDGVDLESIKMHISRLEEHPLTLIMSDIDKFKLVNDTYGHLAGDQALEQYPRRIKKSLRRTDKIYRYGGEEFAVLLKNTSAQNGFNIADSMRLKVADKPLDINLPDQPQFSIKKTASFGISTLNPKVSITQLLSHPANFFKVIENADNLDGYFIDVSKELISKADKELYRAKEQGRNRVCCGSYESIQSKVSNPLGKNMQPPVVKSKQCGSPEK